MRPSLILAILAIAVVTIAAVRLLNGLRLARAQDTRMRSAFVPDSHNSTSVSVRGWNRQELEQILGDFRRQYDIPDVTDWPIEARQDNALAITFPADIEPQQLIFLVNYTCYPQNFDLSSRTIGVAAHVNLSEAFGVPDPALNGKNALIYVPADDTDYDCVYAKLDAGRAYKISFTNFIWEPVLDPRTPESIRGL